MEDVFVVPIRLPVEFRSKFLKACQKILEKCNQWRAGTLRFIKPTMLNLVSNIIMEIRVFF